LDALYFRVSSERQTTENQFEDLIQVAEKDESGRNWVEIRKKLSQCIQEEQLSSGRLVYRIQPEALVELTGDCIYVEQGKSGRVGAKRRPLFEQMKRDAALRKFDRLLVWKVSRLGRDMREVISTVYELSDLSITVVPIKSQTGPINSVMGKLLWAIQAWYAEMENGERSEAIRAGQARAVAAGKRLGRPRAILDANVAARLRQEGHSWRKIAATLGVGTGTVRRAYQALKGPSDACQNCST
jgi:putative DNA-invertase from lambdoid prophage Rac